MTKKRETIEEKLSYREPMKIKEIVWYQNGNEYALCPKCNKCIEREYMEFCVNCGQKINWRRFTKATVRKEKFVVSDNLR